MQYTYRICSILNKKGFIKKTKKKNFGITQIKMRPTSFICCLYFAFIDMNHRNVTQT